MRWLVLFLSLAVAQTSLPETLQNAQAVVEQINSVETQLVLTGAFLKSDPVTAALRDAALRGVDVFIMVTPAQAEAPDSYVPYLELFDQVQVRLAEVEGASLVGDSLVIDGPLVLSETVPFDARETYVLRDEAIAGERLRRFQEQWEKAAPYTSFIKFITIETER